MDWFRWWHGTVTDPKFQWVGRKSGQSVASVIAVWAVLLEIGSNATQGNADATRGNVASLQCEDWDVALGLDDGAVAKIFAAMEEKGLIRDFSIVAWDQRQPKREDAGNPNTGALSSTERSRIYREKKKRTETEGNDVQRDATDATQMHRLDKIREDKKQTNQTWAAPDWVPAEAWKDFEQMRSKRKKPLTDRARALAVNELAKLRDAGNDVAKVIEQTVLHSWDTFYPLKSANASAGANGSDARYVN